MKTATKVGLITSFSMVVVGIGMIITSLAMAGGDLEAMFRDSREKRVVSVDEPYTSIRIETNIDSVKLDYSPDNNETTVELYENDSTAYDVTVEDRTLIIRPKNTSIGFTDALTHGVAGRSMVVHLTGGEYKDIKINTGIGSIDIPGSIYVDTLTADTGIGEIRISKAASIDTIRAKTGIGGINTPPAKTLMIVDTGIGHVTVT